MDNKFEDTRKSIVEILSLFSKEALRAQYRDKEFERTIIQVINNKSNKNYELFVYTFDIIFYSEISNFDEYTNFMKKYSNRKLENLDKGIQLYFEVLNSEDRDETIKLAFNVYKQHLRMVEIYKELFSEIDKTTSEIGDGSEQIDHPNMNFDIFLSHRYYLKFYNIIIFYILSIHYALNVYVDWIFDYDIDRKTLTPDTVKLLKERMKQSRKLLFFNILSSATTNWMAWEVGYFSCLRKDSIGILDLDGYCNGNKNVEVLSSNDTLKYNDVNGIYVESSKSSIKDWVK